MYCNTQHGTPIPKDGECERMLNFSLNICNMAIISSHCCIDIKGLLVV